MSSRVSGPLPPAAVPAKSAGAQAQVSRLVQDRLDWTADFYNAQPTPLNRFGQGYRELLARYYRYLIPPAASVLEIGCGGGDLLARLPNEDVAGIDVSVAQVERARSRVPRGQFRVGAGETLEALGRTYDFVILSETLNFAADVQSLLQRVHAVSTPATRLLCNFYSSLWRPVLSAATILGLKARAPQSNWLSAADVRNLCELADWQVVKTTSRLLCPVPVPVLATLLNRYVAPWLPWACVTVFGVARPQGRTGRSLVGGRSVSVIVPARNEAGNIENVVRRTPAMGAHTELVFIEGHSADDTWEAIQHAVVAHPDLDIKALRQSGRGKGNAVREAFAAARGDILMILDADLTVPPEDLPKFYDALARGHAEFANGVRLVYPMEKHAMQFLNLCANKAFSLIFTWLLGQPVKDTLCGTKALLRSDYEKIAANRPYFGEFDPFGDFDLLFGADKLGLKIADIPIHYRERTYGSTNIHRWSHGWLLLRMVLFAARKLKFV